MIVSAEITVKGRVQGVGYRFFALNMAKETGVKGYVKNLPDGNVFLVVQGTKTQIETFTDYLKIGPARARIDSFELNRLNNFTELQSFSVKY